MLIEDMLNNGSWDSLSDTEKRILDFDAPSKAAEDNWAWMVRVALDNGAKTSGDLSIVLEESENRILEIRESLGQNVKTKGGKWKRTKVCDTSTYSSSKTVVGKGLDYGIEFMDHVGKVKGKSRVELEIKAMKAGFDSSQTHFASTEGLKEWVSAANSKTPMENASHHLDKLRSIYDTLDGVERDTIEEKILSAFSSFINN